MSRRRVLDDRGLVDPLTRGRDYVAQGDPQKPFDIADLYVCAQGRPPSRDLRPAATLRFLLCGQHAVKLHRLRQAFEFARPAILEAKP